MEPFCQQVNKDQESLFIASVRYEDFTGPQRPDHDH